MRATRRSQRWWSWWRRGGAPGGRSQARCGYCWGQSRFPLKGRTLPPHGRSSPRRYAASCETWRTPTSRRGWPSLRPRVSPPSSVQRTHGVLSQVFDVALRDRRIASNPAGATNLPRKTSREKRFLTADQVEALAEACDPYGTRRPVPGLHGPAVGRDGGSEGRRRRPAATADARASLSHRGQRPARLRHDQDRRGPRRAAPPVPGGPGCQLCAGRDDDDLVFEGTRGGVLRNRNFDRRTFAPAARQHR